jgi:pyridoxamine 5'-phosphate oxidase
MSKTADPLARAAAWLGAAERDTSRRNPLAMALATCTPAGKPSVRMVLLRGFAPEPGFIVFYTHYRSRKGTELTANPRAAGVLYWEELGRQLRIEGPVTRSPATESDQYFAHRPLLSQLNAWASAQSERLDDPATLLAASDAKARELGLAPEPTRTSGTSAQVPRPPHWGGFRIWIESLEFWSEGEHRFHEREVYRRGLEQRDDGSYTGSTWTYALLQP